MNIQNTRQSSTQRTLGLFVCKKRFGKENAQWITGNYATQSARQKKKSYLSEIEPIIET